MDSFITFKTVMKELFKIGTLGTAIIFNAIITHKLCYGTITNLNPKNRDIAWVVTNAVADNVAFGILYQRR